MNKIRLFSIVFRTVLVIILVSAAAVSFINYSRKMNNEVKLLERDLEKTKGELQKLIRKSAFLTVENKDLNREFLSLKENVTAMQQAKDMLGGQIEALSLEKKNIENKLIESTLLNQEQVSLKEKDFQKKLDFAEEEFLIQEKALAGQIEGFKVKLKNLTKENEVLITILKKNEEKLSFLQKSKAHIQLKQAQKRLKQKAAELGKEIEKNEVLLIEAEESEREKSGLQNQLKQAQEQLRKQTAKFHYNLGLVYDESRRYKEAMAEYKKALKMVSDDPDIHYNLGVLYDEHIKDKRKAIKHYQAYLRLCPAAEDTYKVTYWVERAKQELEFQ